MNVYGVVAWTVEFEGVTPNDNVARDVVVNVKAVIRYSNNLL